MSIITRFVEISGFKENSSKNALIKYKKWIGSVEYENKSHLSTPFNISHISRRFLVDFKSN